METIADASHCSKRGCDLPSSASTLSALSAALLLLVPLPLSPSPMLMALAVLRALSMKEILPRSLRGSAPGGTLSFMANW